MENAMQNHGHPLPILLILLLLYCCACGGSESAAPQPQAGLAAPPAGVDAGLWQDLNSELQRVLEASGRERSVSAVPSEPGNRVTQIGVEDSGDGGVNVGWYYRNIGDYDLNGEVNIADLTPVGVGFQATDADADWFRRGVADGDGNGQVNIADITPIGVHFGNSVTGYIIEHTTTPEDLGSYLPVGEILLSEGEVIPAKVPSNISLPTEVKQVYLESKFVEFSAMDTFAVRPFFGTGSDRQLGIASYEEHAPTASLGWSMAGGNAGHTGQADVYFGTDVQLLYTQGGLNLAVSTLPEYDEAGNYYLGSADGMLHKFDQDDNELWSVSIGEQIHTLKYYDSEFGLLVGHDGGIAFYDALGQLLYEQAMGRVLSRPLTYFEDASYRAEAGTTEDGKLWSVHLVKDSGVLPAWEHEFGGSMPGSPVSSGLRVFVVRKGLAGADDQLVSLDLDGLDPQTHDTQQVIDPLLGLGIDFRIWASIGGLRLQSYDSDGTLSTAVLPDTGEFTAFAMNNILNRIWIAQQSGTGSQRVLDWDLTLDQIAAEQAIDARATNIIDNGSSIALLGDDGSINSWFPDFSTNWEGAVALGPDAADAPPQISFSPQFGPKGLIHVLSSPQLSTIDNDNGVVSRILGDALNESRLNICFQDDAVQLASRLITDQQGQQLLSAPHIKLAGPLADSTLRVSAPVLSRIQINGTEKRQRAGVSYRRNLLILTTPRIIESAVQREASALGGGGFALFEMDGSLAWDYPLDAEDVGAASFSFKRFLLCANDPASSSYRILCLTEATGTALWIVDLDAAGVTVPVADGNANAYVASETGTVYCISEIGQDIWHNTHPAPATGLVLHGEQLFYCSSDSLVAIDITDGSLDFSETISGGMDATPVLTVSGMLQLATLAGELWQVDPAGSDHTPELLYAGAGSVSAQPVTDASGYTAWINDAGTVYCIDRSGNLLWELESGSSARSELSVGPDGSIYILDELGRLAVIGR